MELEDYFTKFQIDREILNDELNHALMKSRAWRLKEDLDKIKLRKELRNAKKRRLSRQCRGCSNVASRG